MTEWHDGPVYYGSVQLHIDPSYMERCGWGPALARALMDCLDQSDHNALSRWADDGGQAP